MLLGLGMTGCGGSTIAFLWVIGQQYNQVAAFKVDNFTGNLTSTPHQPFSTNGTAPVSIQVKSGGRYVYVLNQGTGGAQGTHATSGNVAVFSVGGDGTLTFQQSYVTQGYVSQWMAFDSTGSYLYVLDKYSPSGDGNGAITAYQVDSSSGRLYLVQNTQSVANGSAALTYFEVGSSTQAFTSPFMVKSTGSCLFVANATQIQPFTFSSGQLVTVTNGATQLSATNISSINGSSSLLSITDSGANSVALYTVGTSCALSAIAGGSYSLAQDGTVNPGWSIIDNSGKYLYVLNQTTSRTLTNITYSSITAFYINTSNGNQISELAGSPFPVGSNPKCMVEDPTSQWLYTADHDSGTVTGKAYNNTTGQLAVLSRGSTFSATGQAQCLAISGATN